jgi:hypothetical protein
VNGMCIGSYCWYDPNYLFFRCETFNSFIRAMNIYGNKRAPSRDIANRFSVIEHLRYICEGGHISTGEKLVPCLFEWAIEICL